MRGLGRGGPALALLPVLGDRRGPDGGRLLQLRADRGGHGGRAGLPAHRRFSSAQQERMWKLLGASALSWGCRQTAWTWYETVLGREVPFPSLADVGYLAAPPLAAAALISLPFAAQSLAGRVRQDDGLSQAISLAYPIGDVVVGTIVLFVLAKAR